MSRKISLSLFTIAVTVATVSTRAAATQAPTSNPFLKALAVLSADVERIGDEVAALCRRDLAALNLVGPRLAELKKLEHALNEIRRRYGGHSAFPGAEARRIGWRIASLEDSLVRLQASKPLARDTRAVGDASGNLFFEAVQTVCPADDAKSVFDDVCKAQGGTPEEECSDCFFGLFTCCEKICSVS